MNVPALLFLFTIVCFNYSLAIDLNPIPLNQDHLEAQNRKNFAQSPRIDNFFRKKQWQKLSLSTNNRTHVSFPSRTDIYFTANFARSRQLIFVEYGVVPVNFSPSRTYASHGGFNLYLPEKAKGHYTKIRFQNFSLSDFKKISTPLINSYESAKDKISRTSFNFRRWMQSLYSIGEIFPSHWFIPIAHAQDGCDLKPKNKAKKSCMNTLIAECPKSAIYLSIRTALTAAGGWAVTAGITAASHVCKGNPIKEVLNISHEAMNSESLQQAKTSISKETADYLKSCAEGVSNFAQFTVEVVTNKDELLEKVTVIASNNIEAIGERTSYLLSNIDQIGCQMACQATIQFVDAMINFNPESLAELEQALVEVTSEVAVKSAESLAEKPKKEIVNALLHTTRDTIKCIGEDDRQAHNISVGNKNRTHL